MVSTMPVIACVACLLATACGGCKKPSVAPPPPASEVMVATPRPVSVSVLEFLKCL